MRKAEFEKLVSSSRRFQCRRLSLAGIRTAAEFKAELTPLLINIFQILCPSSELTVVVVKLTQILNSFCSRMMPPHTWSRICLGCDCPNHYSPSTTSRDEEAAHAGPTFANLLRSNDSPSPSEECELRDSVSAGEACVVAIDDHVAALKKLQQALSNQLALIGAEIEGLDGERRKVVARIAQHKRLLSQFVAYPRRSYSRSFSVQSSSLCCGHNPRERNTGGIFTLARTHYGRLSLCAKRGAGPSLTSQSFGRASIYRLVTRTFHLLTFATCDGSAVRLHEPDAVHCRS